jgi:hypothetical protein
MVVGVSQFDGVHVHRASWNFAIDDNAAGNIAAGGDLSSDTLDVDVFNAITGSNEAVPGHVLTAWLYNNSAVASVNIYYEARWPLGANVWRQIRTPITLLPGQVLDATGGGLGIYLPAFPQFRLRIHNNDPVNVARIEGNFAISSYR